MNGIDWETAIWPILTMAQKNEAKRVSLNLKQLTEKINELLFKSPDEVIRGE